MGRKKGRREGWTYVDVRACTHLGDLLAVQIVARLGERLEAEGCADDEADEGDAEEQRAAAHCACDGRLIEGVGAEGGHRCSVNARAVAAAGMRNRKRGRGATDVSAGGGRRAPSFLGRGDGVRTRFRPSHLSVLSLFPNNIAASITYSTHAIRVCSALHPIAGHAQQPT